MTYYPGKATENWKNIWNREKRRIYSRKFTAVPFYSTDWKKIWIQQQAYKEALNRIETQTKQLEVDAPLQTRS